MEIRKLSRAEQKQAIKRLPGLMDIAQQRGRLVIHEPYSGRSYHSTFTVRVEAGLYFVSFGSTCESAPPANWQETTKERAEATIASCLVAGWLHLPGLAREGNKEEKK